MPNPVRWGHTYRDNVGAAGEPWAKDLRLKFTSLLSPIHLWFVVCREWSLLVASWISNFINLSLVARILSKNTYGVLPLSQALEKPFFREFENLWFFFFFATFFKRNFSSPICGLFYFVCVAIFNFIRYGFYTSLFWKWLMNSAEICDRC